MREDVYQAVRLLLQNDPSVSPAQLARILAACRSQSTAVRRRLGTVRQAAEILACHPRTVYRCAARGYLHPIHHSARKVRFDLDEVESFADRGTDKHEGET